VEVRPDCSSLTVLVIRGEGGELWIGCINRLQEAGRQYFRSLDSDRSLRGVLRYPQAERRWRCRD
jgi:hypothetical protein